MSAQTPQNNQQGNTGQAVVQPTVVNNTATTATGAQINTVQAPATTYYIKFYMSNTSGVNIPYIVVHRETDTDDWTIVKVGKTDGNLPSTNPNTNTNAAAEIQRRNNLGIPLTAKGGLISIPISEVGNYRVYLKEPNTTPIVGNTFTISMHALANGADSTHEVNCWFAFTVEVAADNANNRTVTTYLPNPQNRATPHAYPTMGQTYTITTTHNSSANALLLNNYAITGQLWADISKTYSSNHPLITASTYRTALQAIYNENLTVGTERERTLTYQDGTTQRTLNFIASSTNNANTAIRFSSTNTTDRITADEAIRKTHPCVFIYWMGLAHDLEITNTRITSTWRPALGSTRHRYSLALDVNELTANVVTNQQTNQTTPVTITLRRDNNAGQACNPTLAITTNTSIDDRRKIEFSREFFIRLGEDHSNNHLGWLGGPWTLRYNTNVININQNNAVFIKTDSFHTDHVHLSMGREQG